VGSLLIIYCTVPTEYVGERIVKIGQYLANVSTRVSCLLFWLTVYSYFTYLLPGFLEVEIPAQPS